MEWTLLLLAALLFLTSGAQFIHPLGTATNPFYDVRLTCGERHMVVTVVTPEPFRGRLYAKDHYSQSGCFVSGQGETTTVLKLPLYTSKCGVINLGNGTLLSKVVVQGHPKILRKGDVAFKLTCSFPPVKEESVVSNKLVLLGEGTGSANVSRAGVRVIFLDRGRRETHEAFVGEQLLQVVENLNHDGLQFFPTSVVASPADFSRNLTLLDHKGCVLEPHLFPGYGTSGMWASDELVAKFVAFKFPASDVVNFRVTVNFCKDECWMYQCPWGSLDPMSREQGMPEPETLQTSLMVTPPVRRWSSVQPVDGASQVVVPPRKFQKAPNIRGYKTIAALAF